MLVLASSAATVMTPEKAARCLMTRQLWWAEVSRRRDCLLGPGEGTGEPKNRAFARS